MRIPAPIQTNPPDNDTHYEEANSSTPALQSVYRQLQKALQNPWLKFSLRLGCTLLLFFVLFKSLAKSVSPASLVSKLHTMDSPMLLISMIIGLFSVIISAYQWQCLLDGERIYFDLRKLVNLYLVGIAFNHFFPTGMGGDVVKAYYVGKEGKNIHGSASAVIMSRVTGFIGMMCIAIPTIIVWHTLFPSSLITIFLLSCLAMCAVLSGTLLLVAFLPRLAGKWTTPGSAQGTILTNPLPGTVGKLLAPFLKVGKTIRMSFTRPRFLYKATLFGMVFHMSTILNYYYVAKILHLNVPITFYMLVIPLVSLVSFLPISLNGYGLRESTLVAIFSTIHASTSTVLFMALLMDVQMLLLGTIGGLIYITMGRRHQPEENAQTSITVSTQKLPI